MDDPESTRRAYLVMISLLVLGALLAAFTVWYWRSTRPEPHALGRLEAMGLRRWSRSDWTGRRDLLDRVGPYEGGEGPVTEREGELVAEAERVEAERVEAESIEEAQPRDDTPPADDTGEVDEPVLVPAGALTLAALVEATPAAPVAPYGGSIGDPEVLKALGLDDESLGITVPPVRRPWSTEDRVPVPFTDEDLLDADEDDDAEDDGFVDLPAAEAPTMEPMFEGLGAPAVWSGEDEVTEDEIHEREATGEFVRLVERGDHHDDPRPEQQRFSLPGEPLL